MRCRILKRHPLTALGEGIHGALESRAGIEQLLRGLLDLQGRARQVGYMLRQLPHALDQVDEIGREGSPLLCLGGNRPARLQSGGKRDHVRHGLKIFFCSAEGNGVPLRDPQQTAAIRPAKLSGDSFFWRGAAPQTALTCRLTPL